MAYYAAIRILYLVYFGGVIVFCLKGLSIFIFGKSPLKERLAFLLKISLLSFAWPLFFGSKSGIQTMKHLLRKER